MRTGNTVAILLLFLGATATAQAAATAQVDGGVLVVRGAGADDEVAIASSPDAPGTIRVEALVTKVNGSDFVDFPGVRSLDCDLGGGSDLLRIGSTDLGSDRLEVRGVLVTGAAGVLDLGFVAMSVRGNVEVTCGPLADRVDFGDVQVTGALNVDLDPRTGMAGGADVLGLLNSPVSGAVDVFCGEGDDRVTISSSTADAGQRTLFRKPVLIDLSGGADFLSFVNADAASTLRIVGGDGDDRLGLIPITALGLPPRIGALDVDLGEGANGMLLGSTTVGGTRCGNVEISAGSANDSVTLRFVELAGTVAMDLGAGTDTAVVRNASVRKTTRIELGGGDGDRLIASETRFGKFSADGGEGANDLAQMEDGLSFKGVAAYTDFEDGQGAAVDLSIIDSADATDHLDFDLATGAFELFVDGVSTATGTAALRRKGANVSFVSAGPDFPFTAKMNVGKRSGKCTVRDATGAVVATIKDTDSSL